MHFYDMNCVLSLRVGVNIGPLVCFQELCLFFCSLFCYFVLAPGSQASGTYYKSLIREDFLVLFSLLGSKK